MLRPELDLFHVGGDDGEDIPGGDDGEDIPGGDATPRG